MKYFQVLIKSISIILLFMFVPKSINATHVVGGDMYYECLGNGLYKIVLEFRRDCFNGAPNAQFDDPLSIGIFDNLGNLQFQLGTGGQLFVNFNSSDTLNEILTSECRVEGENVCVHTTTYIDTLFLPSNSTGYYFAYQRCCRNSTLNNIVDPLETGATYWTRITPTALSLCNDAPRFKDWPDVYICANKDLVFDHSAIDNDGDSLVYRLCLPSLGATRAEPIPQPASAPPYGTVEFSSPYSLNDMMGGVPLTIDSKTGIITAKPNAVGQYLIGICVDEYRNGQLLSTTRRDFEYNVRICLENPFSSFDAVTNPNCDGLEINFVNTSSEGSYEWFFDYPNTDLKSVERTPTITYSESGSYEVVLIVSNEYCVDTSRLIVGVSGSLDPDVDFFTEIVSCSGGTIEMNLTDNTQSAQTLTNWKWDITHGDQIISSTLQNPNISLNGLADSVTISLEVTGESGCVNTLVKTIEVNLLNVDILDQATICVGTNVSLINIPDSNFEYSWSPTTNLDLQDPYSPIASPTESTKYYVTISDGICTALDSVSIIVENQKPIELIGDTSLCSGTTNLTIVTEDNYLVEWFSDESLTMLFSTDNPLVYNIEEREATIYARLKDDICETVRPVTISRNDFTLEVIDPSNGSICVGEPLMVEVNPSDDSYTYTYTWLPAEVIESGADTATPTIIADQEGLINLVYSVTNGFCTVLDSISIKVENEKAIQLLGDTTVCDGTANLTILTDANYPIEWYTDESLTTLVSTANPLSYDFEGREITLYAKLVGDLCETVRPITVTRNDFTIQVNDPSNGAICAGESVTLEIIASEEGYTYTYNWFPPNLIVSGANTANPTIQVDQPGSIGLAYSVTNEFDCTVTGFMNIESVAFPDIDFPDPLQYCEGTSIQLNPNGNPNFKYAWESIPAGLIADPTIANPVLNLAGAASFSVTVSGLGSIECLSEFAFDVSPFSNANPVISTDGTEVYCAGDNIMLSSSANIGGESIWLDEDGNIIGAGMEISIKATVDRVITLMYTDDNGCESSTSIAISVADPVLFEVTEDMVVCKGESVALEANNPSLSYSWENAAGDVLSTESSFSYMNTDVTSTVIVIGTDINGCTLSKEVDILVAPDINVNVARDVIDHCGNQMVSLQADSENGQSYEWFDANGVSIGMGKTIDYLAVGDMTVMVVVTDLFGCTESASVQLKLAPDIVISFESESVRYCQEGTATLSASADQDVTYIWYNANGDKIAEGNPATYMPTGTEVVTVQATSTLGCMASKDLTLVPYTLNVELDAPAILCPGEASIISITNLDPTQELTYTWSPQSAITGSNTGSSINISTDQTTTFMVEIKNMDGCTWMRDAMVETSKFSPAIAITLDPDDILLGESTQLEVNQDPDYSYDWSPSVTLSDPNIYNPIATPTDENTTYTVVVTNDLGCTGQASITVTTRQPKCDESDVFVPNMFSPNGDNLNEEFRIESNFVDEFFITIYNRWGEEVFTSNNQDNSWDGTFKGQELEPDVYGYYLRIVCINGFTYTTKGNVTIVK